jgi:pyruvate dehydrogenase E2 component (dihydrolipoamide acetyltransferase)
MPKEVIMPALGMAQETGTLLRWLKREGDSVQQGESIMEIATDKVDVEIEAPASGTLAAITAAEGDEIPVGQTIALILAPGETLTHAPLSSPAAGGTKSTPSAPAQTAKQDTGQSGRMAGGEGPTASPVAARIAAEHNVDLHQITPAGSRIQKEDVLAYIEAQKERLQKGQARKDGEKIPASPKARRLAQEKGIALSTISGSGPDGAILSEDVLAAGMLPTSSSRLATGAKESVSTVEQLSESRAPAQPEIEAEGEVPSRLWQVMAARLTESWTTVPHFYLVRDVSAEQLVAWRSQLQRQGKTQVTYTDLLVKLVALTLKRHPRLNASWQHGRIVANKAVHVGLAVAVADGLLVPVVHDADQLGLLDLATRRADLVQRAGTGKLGPADLQGGTFTISNLGMYGVDAFNAIVNPPQAAILAVGRIADRVVPVNGQPGIRPMMTLTLSCDHRVVDGAGAAQFLATLAAWIEEPLRALE